MKASVCLFSLVLFLSVTTVFAQNQVILQDDFENGKGDWEARGTGSVSISDTKKEAANGKRVCGLRVAVNFGKGLN